MLRKVHRESGDLPHYLVCPFQIRESLPDAMLAENEVQRFLA